MIKTILAIRTIFINCPKLIYKNEIIKIDIDHISY